MAKLVFLRRTEKEIEVFGGDIYFDIDGKNAGILTRNNEEIELLAGQHTIKMYKSHSYDTYIGFAECKISVEETEHLMVRYAVPMQANQPGNIMIYPYDAHKEKEVLDARESAIIRDYDANEKRKRDQNGKYNTGTILWIGLVILLMIIFFL
jgi:hypothetical protein